MEITTRDQHIIHFEVWENLVSEDTVLLHGNLASTNWWLGCVEEWKKNKSSAMNGRVIAIDWRGCGKSSAPAHNSQFTLDVLAEDVLEVLKSLEIKKTNIVGHSTGGLIALKCLSKNSNLFHKAIFLDSVGLKGVSFGPEMIDAFKAMALKKELTAQVIGSTIWNNNPESDFFKNVIVEDAYTGVKQVGIKVLNALHNINLTAEALSITNSCLVVHGEHDVLLPKEDSIHLSKNLKNSEFKTFEGQGHCPNFENPQKCVALINKFLF